MILEPISQLCEGDVFDKLISIWNIWFCGKMEKIFEKLYYWLSICSTLPTEYSVFSIERVNIYFKKCILNSSKLGICTLPYKQINSTCYNVVFCDLKTCMNSADTVGCHHHNLKNNFWHFHAKLVCCIAFTAVLQHCTLHWLLISKLPFEQ